LGVFVFGGCRGGGGDGGGYDGYGVVGGDDGDGGDYVIVVNIFCKCKSLSWRYESIVEVQDVR
jgi:hypothetical protein